MEAKNADSPLLAEMWAAVHKLEEHSRSCEATGCLVCWYADVIRRALRPPESRREAS